MSLLFARVTLLYLVKVKFGYMEAGPFFAMDHQLSVSFILFLSTGRQFDEILQILPLNFVAVNTSKTPYSLFDYLKVTPGGQGPQKLLDDLTHYDIETETWSQVQISNGSRPVPRMSHVAVYENGHIWLHGGYGGRELRELNDLWRYDLDTKTWEEFPKSDVLDVPSPRQMHVAVLVDGHIYIHGGSHLGQTFSDLWCFNITTLSWMQQQPYNSLPPRENHVAVGDHRLRRLWVHGGRGGLNGSMALMNDLWWYDIDARMWMQAQAPFGPSPREMHVAVLVQGSIWLHGGLSPNQYLKWYGGEWLADLWRFDFDQEKWIQRADFPWQALPMINPVAIVSPSHMWIHAGRDGPQTC